MSGKEDKFQAKAEKQRQEIARLTVLVETLRADKSRLLFELNKERARANMLAERLKGA